MIMQYKHHNYCNLTLTLGACNSPSGSEAWKYAQHSPSWCHPDANMFQEMKECFHKIWSVTPTALVNAGYSRVVQTPVNEDATLAAVEQEL